MRIGPKLTLSFSVVACLVIVVGSVGLRAALDTKESLMELADNSYPTVAALEDVRFYGLRIVTSTMEYIFLKSEQEAASGAGDSQDEAELELRENAIEPLNQSLDRYVDMVATHVHEEQNIEEEVVNAAALLGKGSSILIALKEAGESGEEILEAKERFENTEQVFLVAIERALKLENEEVQEVKNEVVDQVDQAIAITLGVALGGFIVAFILRSAMARSLRKFSNAG